MRVFVLILLCLLFLAGMSAQAQKPMSNEDVLEMVKAGFTEKTVIRIIEANETAFDKSAQALLELKKAGVSERVISAMLSAKPSETTAEAASANVLDLPTEVGLYVRLQGKLVPVYPEYAHERYGRSWLFKHGGTLVLKNAHSELRVLLPVEFVTRLPEGVPPSRIRLLRLDKKKNRREIPAWSAGLLGASFDAMEKKAVSFEYEQAAS